MAEIPDHPQDGLVYLVGENSYLWFAVLQCPCGCGGTIQVPLVEGRGPRWAAIVHPDDTITLEPSIWRRVGCHSHFIVRQGEVLWAPGTGHPPTPG